MDVKKLKETLLNWKILLLITSLIASVLSISIYHPVYGSDFVGGISIQAQLEHPVNDSTTLDSIRGILENRLNGMGIKDIQVTSWGDRYILIKIANASPAQIYDTEKSIMQQAKLVEKIDGKTVVKGDEITIDTSSKGTLVVPYGTGYKWEVAVIHNKEGACRFFDVGKGKMGRPIDTFLDAPENSAVLMTTSTYDTLGKFKTLPTSKGEDILFGDATKYLIEERCGLPIVVLKNKTNESFNEIFENISVELNRLKEEKNITRIIILEDKENISQEIKNLIAENGFSVVVNKRNDRLYGDWIKEFTGLTSAPTLNFDPDKCVYNALISGYASTKEAAEKELKFTEVVLTSGNLPVKILPICGSYYAGNVTPCGGEERTFDATLGMGFLQTTLLAGLIAIIGVTIVVFLRYRKAFIILPIMITCLSEVLIILGVASAIHWELDLLAVAGIIVAIGTGVDNQIVITDETLKRGSKKEVVSVSERIKRAFFIIFTGAFTTMAAMIPMFGISAGILKGFAFTTILGVLIGITITRPAYAKIIEFLIKYEEKER